MAMSKQETAFLEQLKPLIDQLNIICQEHGISNVMGFAVASPDGATGNIVTCGYFGESPLEALRQARNVLTGDVLVYELSMSAGPDDGSQDEVVQ